MSIQTRMPHLVALALSALTIHSAHQFHVDMTQRIDQQTTLIKAREEWNSQHAAMQPLKDKWHATMPIVDDLIDQYRIIQRINAMQYNLRLNETGIIIADPTQVTYNGKPTGIMRYPLGNQGATLVLTASDYASAWQALKELQSRPDLRFSRARLENDKGIATLYLENFALLARTDAK